MKGELNGLNRRSILRGMLGGSAISVGLPLLDCFLNTNGTALADGNALPSVFGTWFQGLGFNPGFWEPKTEGLNYTNNLQFKEALDPIKHKVTIFSGLKAYTDGNALIPHVTGIQVCMTGGLPKWGEAFPSVDTLVADQIGLRSRFRSIEVSSDGSPTSSSARSFSSTNPSEVSPVALYTRIFGPDFQDPNSDNFKPDPLTMARKSVLSGVSERRAALAKQLGAADKVRLDEYYSSLRGLENQLAVQLEKPAKMPACVVPAKTEEAPYGTLVEDVRVTHRLFTALLVNALACGQTRVVNMNFAGTASGLRSKGIASNFHAYTHEEQVDPKLGYQPTVAWFQNHVIHAYAEFITALDNFKEGPTTLLDRAAILYSTDVGLAKFHAAENIPMILSGGAAGKLKPGYHIAAPGQTAARVGLTIQQAFGLPVSTWGTESNRTSKPFTEIMA